MGSGRAPAIVLRGSTAVFCSMPRRTLPEKSSRMRLSVTPSPGRAFSISVRQLALKQSPISRCTSVLGIFGCCAGSSGSILSLFGGARW